jgi:broad specificity phosphatase PhoE
MKKRIYLARHGETDWNLEGRMQGRTDVVLNAAGKEQAERLADAAAGLEIGSIVSSPLRRAAMTAEIISGRIKLPVSYHAGLVERSFGEAEGMLKPEVIEKFGHLLVVDGEHIDWGKTCLPGGESREEAMIRIRNALRETLPDDSADNVLVVMHGANIQMMLGVTGVKNCDCFRAEYDTETGEFSDVERVCEDELSS